MWCFGGLDAAPRERFPCPGRIGQRIVFCSTQLAAFTHHLLPCYDSLVRIDLVFMVGINTQIKFFEFNFVDILKSIMLSVTSSGRRLLFGLFLLVCRRTRLPFLSLLISSYPLYSRYGCCTLTQNFAMCLVLSSFSLNSSSFFVL